MADEVLPGNVMLHCGDEQKLQKFYGGLLGWEMRRPFGRPAVRSASGAGFLFAEEADDLRPTQPGKQQKQMHFDFRVDDIAEMAKRRSPGRPKGSGTVRRTGFCDHAGPGGHPFYLCRKGRLGQRNLKSGFLTGPAVR